MSFGAILVELESDFTNDVRFVIYGESAQFFDCFKNFSLGKSVLIGMNVCSSPLVFPSNHRRRFVFEAGVGFQKFHSITEPRFARLII